MLSLPADPAGAYLVNAYMALWGGAQEEEGAAASSAAAAATLVLTSALASQMIATSLQA